MQILKSQDDASINFVTEQEVGNIETRYVRRGQDYFICYLSSQTGCNRGCRFCHLTATGQTRYRDVREEQYYEQARTVLEHYKTQDEAEIVNYNFMARGEPLSNVNLVLYGSRILNGLADLAWDAGLIPRFNISSIMPSTLRGYRLQKVFRVIQPTFYYSLYSTNPSWRKKWMPGAMEPEKALDILADYQQHASKIVKIHYPFIAGQNDSLEEIESVCNLIKSKDLVVDFNLVRYNPPDGTSRESRQEILERNLAYIQANIKGRARVVNRVGYDVYASCGMFVSGKEQNGKSTKPAIKG